MRKKDYDSLLNATEIISALEKKYVKPHQVSLGNDKNKLKHLMCFF